MNVKLITKLREMVVVAVVIATLITNIAVATQIVLNGGNDSYACKVGNILVMGYASFDDQVRLTPIELVFLDSPKELSCSRRVVSDNWITSVSFGQHVQWSNDEYIELISISTLLIKEEYDGYGIVISTEKGVTISITTYEKGVPVNRSWNPNDQWHKPKIRG